MEHFVVEGGRRLSGEVHISGAKNASLPIIAATLLCEGKHEITGIPKLLDIVATNQLLNLFGAEIETNGHSQTVVMENNGVWDAPFDLVKKTRASIMVLGPLLAVRGKALIGFPGGDAIGERPIDLHLKAFSEMGADVSFHNGLIEAVAPSGLSGADIAFPIVTVTGTKNVMMAATLADGKTTIRNAALEPEVVDLANFLKSMGANITGEGTKVIEIEGVKSLKPTSYKVMSDRIEAGTMMCVGAFSDEGVKITNCQTEHLESMIDKLTYMGVDVEIVEDRKENKNSDRLDTIFVKKSGNLKNCDINTDPFPMFPTDMQAQFITLLSVASGTSYVTENIFENRFMHVPELCKMGADIKIDDTTAIINGMSGLRSSTVYASDVRASASLVLAALIAEGTSEVRRIYHLDRGYESFDSKLNALGANIERVLDNEI